MKKIFIISEGGLGNQLFQAAFAHYLALNLPNIAIVFLNANSKNDRKFELQGFFQNCSHVGESKARIYFRRNFVEISDGLNRIFGRFINVRSIMGQKFQPQGYKFDLYQMLNQLKRLRLRNIYVRGYFQTYLTTISQSKCFDDNLFRLLHSKTSFIEKSNFSAVAHIRRGDYEHLRNFGPLSLRYFEENLKNIGVEIKDVLIHSDAITSIRDDINFDLSKIEFSHSLNPWELFKDSIDAKYFLGSNSTLSWWAAYIQKRGSTVDEIHSIFPSEWLRGIRTNDIRILFPDWEISNVFWEI